MAQIKAEFSGAVVADPEVREVGGNKVLEFPVYVNHDRKNAQSGDYEPTGDVSKIRVSLWRDLAGTDIRKNDIVRLNATLVEKEFDKRDGTKGRSLQTGFVNEIEVVFRKNDAPRADAGFIPGNVEGFGSEGDGFV